MNHDDADLRSLFEDAVSDVVPGDRLGQIRRATAQTASRRPRRWALVLAAGTATAAVVGAGAALSQLGLPDGDDVAGPGDRRTAVATYYVGTTPDGDRLFREFQVVPTDDDLTVVALRALQLLETDAGPRDPDYRTDWPDGSFVGVQVVDGLIRVDLADRVDPLPAAPSAQQAIYTVQAALGQTLPVQMTTPEGTLDINGDGTSEAVRDAAMLTPVNISDPAEGHSVSGVLTMRGTVRAADATVVPWSLNSSDGEVALSGNAPVDGKAWETTADIADLAPGRYVLTVSVANNNGTATDTRTVTVR